MSNKKLGIILFVISVIGAIILSIWCGFPSPVGFDRVYVVYVLSLCCVGGIIAGISLITSSFIAKW